MLDKSKIMELVGKVAKGELGQKAFFEQVAEEIAKQMGATRASFWTYPTLSRDRIVCEALFDQRDGKLGSGFVLKEEDFPDYFEAMSVDGQIVASHAEKHKSTACFQEAYFLPLDIYSLLDVEVRLRGETFGLFCCENCAAPMEWSKDQVDYLSQCGKGMEMALKKLYPAK